jgi:Tfp pilus assembly protein PilZ
VLPPGRKDDTRRRARRGGAGLVLACTHVSETRIHSGPRPNLALELRDLGWGGLQFIAREPLRPPCGLSVQIKDPSTGDMFHARGTVTWCDTRRVVGGEIHVVGIKFDEIYTPVSRCAWFFQGPEPPAPNPGEALAKAGANPRRRQERFPVDDYFVSVCREGPFGSRGKPVNLAFRLVDLSRTGAQVVCTEQVDPGAKVRFILHLNRFSDMLQTDAEVVWIRRAASRGGRAWSLGIQFKLIDRAAQKLLEYMMNWFSSEKERHNRPE